MDAKRSSGKITFHHRPNSTNSSLYMLLLYVCFSLATSCLPASLTFARCLGEIAIITAHELCVTKPPRVFMGGGLDAVSDLSLACTSCVDNLEMIAITMTLTR